jgi:hypothetical protein
MTSSSHTGGRTTIWPQDVLAARLPHIAAKIGLLITDPRRWVERRVEQITFVDDTTIRRRTSVHFIVPDFQRRAEWEPTDVTLTHIPLALSEKEVMVNLDILDEAGTSLPVVTRRQNAAIAAELLIRRAGAVCAGPLESAVEYGLKEVAGVEERGPQPSMTPEAEAQAETLSTDIDFANLLRALWSSFVLIIPLDLKPNESRVIKFAFDRDFGAYGRGPSEEQHRGVRRVVDRTLRIAGRGLELFGLRDYKFAAETVAVSQCDSYHAEIVAPDEAAISSASLVAVEVIGVGGRIERDRPEPPRWHKRAGLWLTGHPWRQLPIAEDWATDRAHLYPESGRARTVASAVIAVSFCLRTAIVFPVFLLTALTSATLGGGVIAHHFWSVHRSGDTAAAVVVALPSFFAPFVVPGQHRLVRRMFKGLRGLVIASALISFAAAATLAVQLSTAATVHLWIALSSLSGVLTGVAALALLHSGWKTSPLPVVNAWLGAAMQILRVVPALLALLVAVRLIEWLRRNLGLEGVRNVPLWPLAIILALNLVGIWFAWAGRRRVDAKRRLGERSLASIR